MVESRANEQVMRQYLAEIKKRCKTEGVPYRSTYEEMLLDCYEDARKACAELLKGNLELSQKSTQTKKEGEDR